ncbi:MAG: bacterial Ig-like domain-containing protein [Clostridia bacterium]|nr:bacterial Ig-like domain-containing protein [Clostridia bacterium]
MRRIIAFLLSFLMTHSAGLFALPESSSRSVKADEIVAMDSDSNTNPVSSFKVGDKITFGNYPQTKVTSTTLISALDKVSKTWVSYNYCMKSSDASLGLIETSDYMKYCDFSYLGSKYRAVTFSQYRPSVASDDSAAGKSLQDDNGYSVDTVYYFKFEAIKWVVLDPIEGYIMCDSVIDSQAFNNYLVNVDGSYYGDPELSYYASDWANCSLRKWLNEDFLYTAFAANGREMIGLTQLENKSTYSNDSYDTVTTHDKIFLPSYYDVINADYGFNSAPREQDDLRKAKGTDYAKSQGLYVVATLSQTYRNPIWRLRTCDGSSVVWNVDNYGRAYNFFQIDNTSYGVRPALKFNPEPLKSTVTFDANGGEIEETERKVITGSTVGELPVPTREGCEFDGWFTDSEGGYRINADEGVDEDVTFYAHWIASPIELIVDSLPEKLNYLPGEEFDPTGVSMKIKYSDGSFRSILPEETELIGFDSSLAESQQVFFRYIIDDVTLDSAPFTVDIGRQVMSIEVTHVPNKTGYVQGEHFDASGLAVVAQYSDSSSEDVTDLVVLGGMNAENAGTKIMSVTYTYKGKSVSAEFSYTVSARLSSIKLTSLPEKQVYLKGESLSTDGLTVMASFADGTVKEVKDYTVSGFDPNAAGKQIITVSYVYATQIRTAKFAVIVK